LISKNNYKNSYCPTITTLARRTPERRSVMGSAELGFGLGFENVLDDHYLGYYTGKEPAFIVLDRNYRGFMEMFRRERPEVYRYIRSLLEHRYREVYSNSYYIVWARSDEILASQKTANAK
jgi:hypothetical protein